jgi:hypothetical protein
MYFNTATRGVEKWRGRAEEEHSSCTELQRTVKKNQKQFCVFAFFFYLFGSEGITRVCFKQQKAQIKGLYLLAGAADHSPLHQIRFQSPQYFLQTQELTVRFELVCFCLVFEAARPIHNRNAQIVCRKRFSVDSVAAHHPLVISQKLQCVLKTLLRIKQKNSANNT